MNQKHLLCFDNFNIIKSNEGAINPVHANFPYWLILRWKYIYSPNKLCVCSARHCNCLERSMLGWVDIENKISSTFYNKEKSRWKALHREATKFAIKELIYKVEKSTVFIDAHTNERSTCRDS